MWPSNYPLESGKDDGHGTRGFQALEGMLLSLKQDLAFLISLLAGMHFFSP